MSKTVSVEPDAVAPPPPIIDDRGVREFAIKYDLRMAQVRGLIAIYGSNPSKLVAAARRLTAEE